MQKLRKHTFIDICLFKIDSPNHDDEMQTSTNDGNLLISNPSQRTTTNKSTKTLIPKPDKISKSFSTEALTREQRYERRASMNSSHPTDLPVETNSQETGSNMQNDPIIQSNLNLNTFFYPIINAGNKEILKSRLFQHSTCLGCICVNFFLT